MSTTRFTSTRIAKKIARKIRMVKTNIDKDIYLTPNTESYDSCLI